MAELFRDWDNGLVTLTIGRGTYARDTCGWVAVDNTGRGHRLPPEQWLELDKLTEKLRGAGLEPNWTESPSGEGGLAEAWDRGYFEGREDYHQSVKEGVEYDRLNPFRVLPTKDEKDGPS